MSLKGDWLRTVYKLWAVQPSMRRDLMRMLSKLRWRTQIKTRSVVPTTAQIIWSDAEK